MDAMVTDAPKAMLFDLDGTLLDTAPDLGGALNAVLNKYQLPTLSFNEYRNVSSHGSMGLLNRGFGDKLNGYDIDLLKQQFLDHYNDNVCVDTCLFEGVEDLLRVLDERGIPWGIVTNKPGWLTDQLIPQFAAFNSCQVVISGDTLAERKPHPLPLLHAAEVLQIPAAHTWYIGDALRDIESANAAQMTSVIASYGYIEQSEQPELWGADLSIDEAMQLIRFL